MPRSIYTRAFVAMLLTAALSVRPQAAGDCVLRDEWPPAASTTPHEDPAIRQALLMLGQPVNPIRLLSPDEVREIYRRTPGARIPPAGLNAFRLHGDPRIYLNAGSEVYRRAARHGSGFDVLRLAATILHEQVHDSDAEFAAYRRQADFILSRLKMLSGKERAEAARYWRSIDTRAAALYRIEKRRP